MNIDSDCLYDIVITLNGPCGATENSFLDEERLENLKRLIELTDKLFVFIDQVGEGKSSQDSSCKKIGKTAYDFVNYFFGELRNVR